MVKLEPIDTQERLYVRVAKRIADLVLSGDVSPGDKLPSERDLAAMLKVSRPSIREAMVALEVSGLIEVRTGSGIYVADQKLQQPAVIADEGIGPFEILEMRLLIEPEVCALPYYPSGRFTPLFWIADVTNLFSSQLCEVGRSFLHKSSNSFTIGWRSCQPGKSFIFRCSCPGEPVLSMLNHQFLGGDK